MNIGEAVQLVVEACIEHAQGCQWAVFVADYDPGCVCFSLRLECPEPEGWTKWGGVIPLHVLKFSNISAYEVAVMEIRKGVQKLRSMA